MKFVDNVWALPTYAPQFFVWGTWTGGRPGAYPKFPPAYQTWVSEARRFSSSGRQPPLEDRNTPPSRDVTAPPFKVTPNSRVRRMQQGEISAKTVYCRSGYVRSAATRRTARRRNQDCRT